MSKINEYIFVQLYSIETSYHSLTKKNKFRIIIGQYDVSVAKKIDQSESVNKPLTKTGTNEH